MKRSVPKISVAMPVLNGGADLRLAVESILRQTFADWELLLIDDGSSDGAIEALGLDDPRVRLVRDGGTLGLAARLNQAIGLAQGAYFARMDADDISHPERFSRQVAFLDARPEVDLLGTRCITIDGQTRVLGSLPFAETHAEICARPWGGFYLAHPTWMGRTSWFRAHRYADPAPYYCEDQELLLRTHATSCFAALPEALFAYRVRGNLPFRKLMRIRMSWLRVQARVSMARGAWGNLVLGGAVTVARLVWGCLGVLTGTPTLRVQWRGTEKLMPSDLQVWRGRLLPKGEAGQTLAEEKVLPND